MPVSDPHSAAEELPPLSTRAMPPSAAARRVTRPIYRVFVSSTWLDLQPERRALMEALNRMEEMRFVGMEFFGNRPDDTHDASIDQVDLCDVFVGIIGFRYGSGITEAEYRRARELGLPCFVYFKHDAALAPELTDGDPALAAKLAQLKGELLRGHTVKEFRRPEELAANATADLHNWVAARWVSVDATPTVTRPAPLVPDADRTNLLRLVDRLEHDWVQGVLEASLHHRAWLELGLDWRDDAVEHPWDRIVVAPDRPIQTLPRDDSISGVFASAQGTLLILGEPGAGKTTTLLELARDLVGKWRAAAGEAAPVVLALSTWTGEQRDFADWIVAELGLRYQVPKRIARDWLEAARLSLLLDGLDEVPTERREACVTAINAFEQAYHPPGLAVTCRVAEYESLATKLRLRAAICLQPLTATQVERYLVAAGPRLESLRAALRDDAVLRELARTPLMLSVMALAWNETGPTRAPVGGAGSVEERRRQLFDAYVQTALNRPGKGAGTHSPDQIGRTLGWMAARMREHGQTLFAIEQLQPGWIGSVPLRCTYYLVTRILSALVLALPFLLWPGPRLKMMAVLALAVVVGGFIALVDAVFALSRGAGARRGSYRQAVLVVGFVAGIVAWFPVINAVAGRKYPAVVSGGILYLIVALISFCTALDVRSLDVKPSASVRWAWRQGCERALITLVGTVLVIALLFVGSITIEIVKGQAAPTLSHTFGDGAFAIGAIVSAAVVVWLWRRWQVRMSTGNVIVAVAMIILGGEIGSAAAPNSDPTTWVGLLLQAVPAAVMGVFGGFASTMIDPTRRRPSGAWFWLRVPVSVFLLVASATLLPSALVDFYSAPAGTAASALVHDVPFLFMAAIVCGLAGFFRSGGFNGVQHLVLRWLLVRAGHLPRGAEALLERAAQIALLQKVGFGYRFIHALLLDHFAEPARVPADRR